MSKDCQRAYTLKLCGDDRSQDKNQFRDVGTWRDYLWKTHDAINKGVEAFGNSLLTLRGGLDHRLSDAQFDKDKVVTESVRKRRRILLALSWLSVESRRGAPDNYVVKYDSNKNEKLISEFISILKERGLEKGEIDIWKKDCIPSLCSSIRDDAVWVNRSKSFDDYLSILNKNDIIFNRSDIFNTIFGEFFGPEKSYFKEVSDSNSEGDEKNFAQKASGWLSRQFGTGDGADFSKISKNYFHISTWCEQNSNLKNNLEIINNLASYLKNVCGPVDDKKIKINNLDYILNMISGTGYKSQTRNFIKKIFDNESHDLSQLKKFSDEDMESCKEKIGFKRNFNDKNDDENSNLLVFDCKNYSDFIMISVEEACGFSYLCNNDDINIFNIDLCGQRINKENIKSRHPLFVVMLDHAARRVSQVHSWIKLAEFDREKFEEDANKITEVPEKSKIWLDEFCANRSYESGSLEPYRIRFKAIGGWDKIVSEWGKKGTSSRDERIAIARGLQDDPSIEKFGDIYLFEALSSENAECVWANLNSKILFNYVKSKEAEFKKKHFKVPAYRHPDSLLNPVFCDFGESRPEIKFAVHKDRRVFSRTLLMKLFDGKKISSIPLRWQSKRFFNELASLSNPLGDEFESVSVSRKDRFSLVSVPDGQAVDVDYLFDQKSWNGRLEAPREQFEQIAKVRDNNDLSDFVRTERIAKLLNHVNWFVTFSAKLKSTSSNDFTSKIVRGSDYIGRPLGLRILSVDLGHRHAASCSVWETVATKEIFKACQRSGISFPKSSDLFLHIKEDISDNNKFKQKTTVFRRIGDDSSDDSLASWARLDRQFIIKLQGEEEGAREASNDEIWRVHQFEAWAGKSIPFIDRLIRTGWGTTEKQKRRLEAWRSYGWDQDSSLILSDPLGECDFSKISLSVDDLMMSVVRSMIFGLRRHSERAKICFGLSSDYKISTGGNKIYLDDKSRTESVRDALVCWYKLFTTPGWRDENAKMFWDTHISGLLENNKLDEFDSTLKKSNSKEIDKKNSVKLLQVADCLLKDRGALKEISQIWKLRWDDDDKEWRMVIRQFNRWFFPRHKSSENYFVGGLSLSRLSVLSDFHYKIQKSFFTRFKPDGSSEIARSHFGQKALDTFTELREQRVKQLSSRIVEAALGLGRMERQDIAQSSKRPVARKDDPCSVIVIEYLKNYRPDELRTRKENKRLMDWSSSKIEKLLRDACDLHGLYLHEVSASYTSRQDSRTGAPGLRCQDVSVFDFIHLPFWKKSYDSSKKRINLKNGDAVDEFICALRDEWKDKPKIDYVGKFIRIPVSGGEIFVSADRNSPVSKGLQSDLNASANIGLKALTDPNWRGRWWYVSCFSKNNFPVKDKCCGSSLFSFDHSFVSLSEEKTKERKKDIVNFWSDVSSLSFDDRKWKMYGDYKNDVQIRVVDILKKQFIPELDVIKF